jgi:hypothetical protein
MNNNVAAGKPLPPLEELNKENLTRFVSRIRERGFENEAAELLEVPAIKKILSR